jgi:arylsulfatase A-like enzyme
VLVLSALALTAFAPSSVVAAAADGRPNVVVILTDDQRYDTLNAMPQVRKLLRKGGISYRNAFVPSSLCCPSRVSILTGLHSHTTGVISNGAPHGGFAGFDDRISIATALDDAGYRTAFVGKYLNGYVGRHFDNYSYVPPGWDRWFTFPTGSYYGYHASLDGVKTAMYGSRPGDYSARVMTKSALSFIETAGAQPFFLFYSAAAPHSAPNSVEDFKVAIPGPRDVGRLDAIPPWRPITYGNRDDDSDMPAYIQRINWRSELKRKIDLVRQRQLESILTLDRQIGRLVDGLPRNTLVIFLSDNGYLWGEHGWRTKKVPYEESIRIPMILWWPGHADPHVDRRLALNIDVAPTILAAVGLDPATPTGIEASSGDARVPEGLDLLGTDRRSAFVLERHDGGSDRPPSYCGVRTADGWMYARYSAEGSPDDGFEELYDLESDPYQRNNLASSGGSGAKRLELRAIARSLCDPAPPGYDWSS